jgi:hypothetical protein
MALTACSLGFEQEYADDGMPIFDSKSFSNLHPEGALYPENRVTEQKNGCSVTMVSTDTPKHTFTTRYEICDGKSRLHALIHMQDKMNGTAKEVFDLTADREAHFEHTLRFAEIDGDGTAELVALSCSGSTKVEDCKRGWLYRLSKDDQFVNFFSADYQRLWINENYIVTESDSKILGLPRTIDDIAKSSHVPPIRRTDHRTYQVYLRNPTKEITGYEALDKYNENTVTWSHGLLFFTEIDAATGTCTVQFKSQFDGEAYPMHPVPEPVQRFCSLAAFVH